MRQTLLYLWKGSVLTLVLALLAGAGGTLLLRAKGLELLSVQSGSMAPAVRVGDAVVVRRQLPPLKPGDVVSFVSREHGGVVVTHRIAQLDTDDGRLVTKGDATTKADKPITRVDLVGKVEYVAPYAGYALDTFKHPLGLALLVYVPALCIVVAEIQKLSRHYASTARVRYYLRCYQR